MVTKSGCIDVFNAVIRGSPVDFQTQLLPMYSEYLTENNVENSDKLINLVVQNPQLINQSIPKITDYYLKKFNILYITFNNKIILYYE